MVLRNMYTHLAVIFGSILVAAGFNLFLVPKELLSGGVSGLSMLIGYRTGLNIGLLYFLINLPLLIWGWREIGTRFIMLSVVSVVTATVFLQIIPEDPTSLGLNVDLAIASVFGGVLVGVGTGICLRAGGSSGGFDIVGSILARKRDLPIGMVIFALNTVVVLVLGYPDQWNAALWSMLSMYITAKVVDTIHIRHIKVTAFIVTNHTETMREKLMQIPRGVTIMKTRGAFTHTEKDMLMTVTTRYELAALKKIIREVDPKAFVNIVETVEVMGEFRRLK